MARYIINEEIKNSELAELLGLRLENEALLWNDKSFVGIVSKKVSYNPDKKAKMILMLTDDRRCLDFVKIANSLSCLEKFP